MAIVKNTLTTFHQQHPIDHPYFEQDSENERKLLIVLPGRGYTVERPVLHYLIRTALEGGYDVLTIRYAFQFDTIDSDSSALEDDVIQVLQQLPDRTYARIVVAGKSLGTLLIPTVVRHFDDNKIKRILLTPINNASQYNHELSTLAIIGTADPYYNTDDIVTDADRPNILWRVYSNLDHTLEHPTSWTKSINALKDIINDCERFLQF